DRRLPIVDVDLVRGRLAEDADVALARRRADRSCAVKLGSGHLGIQADAHTEPTFDLPTPRCAQPEDLRVDVELSRDRAEPIEEARSIASIGRNDRDDRAVLHLVLVARVGAPERKRARLT